MKEPFFFGENTRDAPIVPTLTLVKRHGMPKMLNFENIQL